MKHASYRVLAGLLLAVVAVLRALSAWLVGAEAGSQEAIQASVQAPDPEGRETGSIRAAVVERPVTEVRPVAVLPPFNNSVLFDQPPVSRRWQTENEVLGTPPVMLAAILASERMYPVPVGVYRWVSRRLRAFASR